MGLNRGFADLLVIGKMDEESGRGILGRKRSGNETVHYLFLAGRNFGTGDDCKR